MIPFTVATLAPSPIKPRLVHSEAVTLGPVLRSQRLVPLRAALRADS